VSTFGDIKKKLSTENHETTHNFRMVCDGIRIPFNGMREDYFVSKKIRIDY